MLVDDTLGDSLDLEVWKGECGRIVSNSKGLRKDRRLQPNKLKRSKSPSRPLRSSSEEAEHRIGFLSIC